MNENDVHACQFGQALDLLHSHVTEMRHELDLQIAGLFAGITVTQVIRFEGRETSVKSAMDPGHLLGGKGQIWLRILRICKVKEGSITFQLGQLESRASGVNYSLKQSGYDVLGVGETHAMEFHEAGIARDVRNQQECRLNDHGVKLSSFRRILLRERGQRKREDDQQNAD